MTPSQYKAERLKRGLTQKGVAALLGVNYMTVQRRELDKLTISVEAGLAIRALPPPGRPG